MLIVTEKGYKFVVIIFLPIVDTRFSDVWKSEFQDCFRLVVV